MHPRSAIVSLPVHGETARHTDRLAGDVGGVIGQQEGHEPRIILRYAEAPHRDRALEPLGDAGAVRAFEKAAQNGGVGRAGADRIEDHALADEFACERLGQRDDSALAGGVDRLAGRADPPRVGCDVDDATEAASGALAFLVNNAGWDRAAAFLDTTPEFWRKVIAINLYGPLNVSHIVLKEMAARGFGRVVNIASDAGRVGSSGEAVYSACKGGIIAFTKTVARELVGKGVILNTLCPGPTDTAILKNFLEGPDGTRIAEALKRAIPMRRLGVPEDYPGLVAFLLSDDAAYMTGQTISVSGGLTMHG